MLYEVITVNFNVFVFQRFLQNTVAAFVGNYNRIGLKLAALFDEYIYIVVCSQHFYFKVIRVLLNHFIV